MEISSDLRVGRRILENIDGYECLKDFFWDSKREEWILHIRLTCDIPLNERVPTITEWYVAVSDLYPDGNIQFFPARGASIQHTFQHQCYNQVDKKNPSQKWLTGNICLKTSKGRWGRKWYDSEPQTARDRLKWFVLRCMDWIYAAATETLVEPGDPFEFPDFPSLTSFRLVFNEGFQSFEEWNNSANKEGIAEIKGLGQKPEVYAIISFGEPENSIPLPKWGNHITDIKNNNKIGIWIMLQRLPVLLPWQIPENYSDLFEICKDQGIDLKSIISKWYISLKNQKKSLEFIILGFPIAKNISEQPSLIHWYAFQLTKSPKMKAFRPNEKVLFNQEIKAILSDKIPINWVRTENWNERQLTSRGQLNSILRESNILLIGAGAIGSIFSELLVRLGCAKLTIIDLEQLNAGNLSRHTLTLTDVGNSKSEALSKRLNSIFPFINVSFVNATIQQVYHSKPDVFNNFDIIVDATGDDPTLRFLSNCLADKAKIFISLSTGLKAERLFCFLFQRQEEQTIEAAFHQKCDPWLELEKTSNAEMEELIEGIGCWHPLFPARLDDIQMLIAAVIQVLEADMSSNLSSTFTVIEKQYDKDKIFTGIHIIKS